MPQFFRLSGAHRSALVILMGLVGLSQGTGLPPRSGRAVSALESYDRIISGLLMAWDVPGAAVAVTKDGRLVYARGFGHADAGRSERVQPESLFRIASLSKPITAVAVLKLVEEGRLELDSPVFPLLRDRFQVPPEGPADPRWRTITSRHLLQHTGGFDRDRSFDPMGREIEIAREMGVAPPAEPDAIIRYMMRRPLDFDPGSRYAYSNFGYCILGRVIEQVSGRTYETYVREAILAPMGITAMSIGKSLRAGRDPREVGYHDERDAVPGPSVFPGALSVMPPDGGFHLEAKDAEGGWIASAVDLARFLVHCDGLPDPPDILKAETVALMTARPQGVVGERGAESWYGMGWSVRPVGQGLNVWHTGALAGTASLMVRAHNGLSWVVLYNRRGHKWGDLTGVTDRKMWEAAGYVTSWPDGEPLGRTDQAIPVGRGGDSSGD